MGNNRHALLALIGGIRCTRTLLPTDYSLVHITSPIDYQHTIILRVEGININHITAIILAYLQVQEDRLTVADEMLDEDQFTAGIVAAVMEGVKHLNRDAKIWLGATAHCIYTTQSGVTVHSTYPDDGKLFPQTQLSLYEKGIHITTQYANELTLSIPTKE